MDQIVEVQRRNADFEGAVHTLLEKLEYQTGADGVQTLELIVELLWNELDRPEECLAHLEDHPQLVNESEELTQRLEELFSLLGRWYDLANHLGQRIESAKEDEVRSDLRYRLASVLVLELEQPEEAFDHLITLLDDQQKSDDAVSLLNAMLENPQVGQDVFRELDAFYERRGIVDERLDAMSVVLPLIVDEDDRLVHLQTMGSLLEQHPGIESAFRGGCGGVST